MEIQKTACSHNVKIQVVGVNSMKSNDPFIEFDDESNVKRRRNLR